MNISWRIEGSLVIISVPAGNKLFPKGAEIPFTTFAPTDLHDTYVNGKLVARIFPNNDGITAENISELKLTQEELLELAVSIDRLNEEGEKLKQWIISLIESMVPNDFKGGINLRTAALGKFISSSPLPAPTYQFIRDEGFFFEGLEFFGSGKSYSRYKMHLNNGKFDYVHGKGFLYTKV